MTTEEIKRIQSIVGTTTDGIYGPLTKAAVQKYQTTLGVTPDGIWGPITQNAYTQSLNTTSGSSPGVYYDNYGGSFTNQAAATTSNAQNAFYNATPTVTPPTSDNRGANDVAIQEFVKANPSVLLPTDTSKITTTPTVNYPTGNYDSGNISNATSSINGLSSYIDNLQKSYEQKLIDAQNAISESKTGKQEQSWLSKLMSAPSPTDVREQATEATGIDPSEYFATQKRGITEIETLTNEYNAVRAARDAQISKTQDVLGSMNFINNQTAQIERNSAPKLNEISANINAKAATLEALQGNFNEAQNYINQAVQDATADLKYNYEMYSMFKEINNETLSKIETNYRDALDTKIQIAEMSYKQAVEDKSLIGQMMIDPAYRGSGITMNDTLEQAYAKASSVTGMNYMYSKSTSSSGSGDGFTPTETKNYESFLVEYTDKSIYTNKQDALMDLEMDKASIVKSIGLDGYNKLVTEVINSLPEAAPEEETSGPGFFGKIWNSIKSIF